VEANWSADIQSFDDFSGRILPISFSPDSRTLAYGTLDGSIKLWDVMTGALKQSLEGHPNDTEEVSLVSFSPVVNSSRLPLFMTALLSFGILPRVHCSGRLAILGAPLAVRFFPLTAAS
jgi:WD40 repeat protein